MKPFCIENIEHENENLDKSDCFVLTILPVGILEQSSLIGNLILVRFLSFFFFFFFFGFNWLQLNA